MVRSRIDTWLTTPKTAVLHNFSCGAAVDVTDNWRYLNFLSLVVRQESSLHYLSLGSLISFFWIIPAERRERRAPHGVHGAQRTAKCTRRKLLQRRVEGRKDFNGIKGGMAWWACASEEVIELVLSLAQCRVSVAKPFKNKIFLEFYVEKSFHYHN